MWLWLCCGLWFTFHFSFFVFVFCFFFFLYFYFYFYFLALWCKFRQEVGLGMGKLIHLFVVISFQLGKLFVTHHHTSQSLSLSHIIKIKWMVRVKDHGQKLLSMKARRERERERVSGVHFCEIMCVYFTYLFTSFLTCPCTSPTLGLTLGVFELCQRFMIILS